MRGRQAACWLIIARVALVVLPFRKVAAYLGQQGSESALHEPAAATERALQVKRAIATACRRLHWDPSCLVRALAATIMLRRLGVDSTLYLGVARDPSRLRAHAWVRCGTLFVTGAREAPQFNVLNTFTRVRA